MSSATFGIVFLAVFTGISSARSINNVPCISGNEGVFSFFSITPAPLSTMEIIMGVKIKMNEVMDMIQGLKNLYRQDGARSDTRDYDEVEILGIHLRNFPRTVLGTEDITEVEIEDVITNDYRILSKIMVFFEKGYNDSVGNYELIAAAYGRIRTKMNAIRCSMSKILRNKGVAIPNIDISSVLNDNIRMLTAVTEQHMRDYIALKDGSYVIEKLIQNYSYIYNNLV